MPARRDVHDDRRRAGIHGDARKNKTGVLARPIGCVFRLSAGYGRSEILSTGRANGYPPAKQRTHPNLSAGWLANVSVVVSKERARHPRRQYYPAPPLGPGTPRVCGYTTPSGADHALGLSADVTAERPCARRIARIGRVRGTFNWCIDDELTKRDTPVYRHLDGQVWAITSGHVFTRDVSRDW